MKLPAPLVLNWKSGEPALHRPGDPAAWWCKLAMNDGREVGLLFWRACHPSPTPGALTTEPITLDTEVRIYGHALVKLWRPARNGPKSQRRLVRLYSLPFGSLVACARTPVPLVLRPPAKYIDGSGIIGSSEMLRVALALELAEERGEWKASGTPRPAPPPEVQATLF